MSHVQNLICNDTLITYVTYAITINTPFVFITLQLQVLQRINHFLTINKNNMKAKFTTLLFVLFSLCSSNMYSQLSNGTIAPNFTLTDINGNTHTLYDYLDAGKTVVIDFSATWCGPCWNYHQTHVLDDLYTQKGPNGTDEVMVFMIESDLGTNLDCIYGPAGCNGTSLGDWTAGVSYPIINLDGSNGPGVGNAYNINFYPTLYSICPDRKTYEVGQPPLSTWVNWITSCTLEGSGAVTANENCYGDQNGAVNVSSSGGWGTNSYLWSNGSTTQSLNGVGAGTYSLTVTEGQGHFVELGPFVIDGPLQPLAISVNNVNNVSCAGQGNGSIVTSTTGGNTGAYQYMWNTGSNNPSLSGISGGTYTLTVTDVNGCTEVETAVVTEPPLLTMTSTATPENCFQADGSIVLNAGGGSQGYLYNIGFGPTTTSSFFNLSAGTYVATVTDGNGCTEVSTAIVEASLPPNANGGPNGFVDCINVQTTLDGTGSTSGPLINYTWSTTTGNIVSGGNTATPTVDAAGTYTLTVSDILTGCTTSDNVDVIGNYVLPTASAGANQSIDCANNEVFLNGSGASNSGGNVTYLWTTATGNIVSGETTPNPLVNATGSYTLIVTDNITGCSETDEAIVLGNTTAPTANAGPNGLLNCNANVINLDGTASSSGGVFSYQWTTADGNILGGSTSLTPTVDASGTYTLVVTNSSNNCTSSSATQVSINNTAPNANAGNGAQLSCTTTSVQLDGSGSSGSSNLSYEWFDDNNNSISNNVTVDVSNAGNYSLVVTNNDNGCDATSSVTVTINNTAPTANASSSGAIDCTAGSVTLSSGGSSVGGYAWFDSNGNNIGNGESVTVNNAGDYDLVVTDNNNGCTALTTVNVVANTSAPAANIAPPANITCTNGTVNLDGSGSSGGSNLSYEWFDASGSAIGNGTNINVSQGGDYSLVVTNNDNGCTDSQTETVTVEAAPPVVNAGSGGTLDCNNTNVNLVGSGSAPSGNVAYEWFDANGNSLGTSAQVNVSAAGTYSFVVTDTGNGCSSSENAIVDENYTAPTANAGNAAQLDCNNTAVTLDGSGSSSGTEFTYSWTDSNGNNIGGGTTVSVSASGTYNLLVTNTNNGCESTSAVSVTENTALPTASAASNGNLNCAVGTVTLNSNGSSTGDYAWFDVTGANIGNGATVDVSNAGDYNLVVTDNTNGCTSSTSISVTSNTTAPSASIAPAGSLDCVINTVTLDGTASSTGANYTYQWLDASGNQIGTGATIDVSAGGDYSLVVTDANNGCAATAVETVTVEASLPTISASADGMLTCNNANVNLNGSGSSTTGNVSYEWFDADGVSLGTSTNVNVSTAGSYSFVVTDTGNGCAATSNVVVVENTAEPNVIIENPNVLTCNNSEVTLDASSSSAGAEFVYQWQDGTGANIGTGATVNVSNAGTYSLIISNTSTGCEASSAVDVSLDIETPTAAASSNMMVLNCATTSVTLDASSSSTGTNMSYEWTDVSGNPVGSGITIQVSNPGQYNLMVVNNSNGCSATSDIVIDEDISSPSVAANSLNALDCSNTSTVLDGTGTVTGTQYTYQWQNANGLILGTELSVEVSTAGVYTLFVMDNNNGCFNSVDVEVIALAEIPVANAGVSGVLNCNTTSLILDAGASSTGTDFIYEWTTATGEIVEGGTTLNPTVTASGEYNLQVTNTSNGCIANSSVTVTQNLDVSVELENVTSINCFGDINGAASVAVSGGTGTYSYQWSNGATEASINQVPAGTYEVVVTDTEDCSSTFSVTIDQPNALVANAGSTDESSFQGNNGTVTATPSGGNGTYTYLWSNGSTEQSQSGLAPGDYTVMITDENGCTKEETVSVDEFICSISSDVSSVNVSCNGADDGQATAFLTVGNNPTYVWSNGETTSSVTSLGTGTFTVTITDENNCPSIQEVTIAQPPAINTTITNVVNVSCANDLTGSATVEGLGGIGNLTYQWSTGAMTATVNNIGAGTYTATVTDENFCSTTIEAIVIANDSELPTAVSQDVAISLDASGVANISSTMVDNGSTDNCGITSMELSQTTFDCSNLGTNEVTFTVIDGAGNQSISTAMVTVTDDILPTIGCVDNIVTNSCNGVAYNMPTATDNCSVATVELVNGLSSGEVFPEGMTEVTYRVTDDSGNEAFCSFFVTVENTLAVESSNVVMPNCNGEANGSLTNLIGGGTPGYTYLWNDGQTTETATNLEAGTYTLQVTDATGCEFEVTSTLEEPEALTFDFEAVDPPCFGAVNGSITAMVGGGTSFYTFVWSDGQTTGTAIGLEADTYTVEVTDANGCVIASPEIVLTEPAQMILTLDNVTNTSTPTSTDGSADITIEGGVGNYTYAWELDGNIVSTDEDLTGATAGDYLLTVTDENGCEIVSDVITIESPTSNVDLSLEKYIRLLPNPTSGTIFVQMELPQTSEVQVRIYDVTGKEIMTSPQQNISNNQLEFNLEQFVNGVYIVKVRVNDSILAKRIVLQKF